MDNVAINNIQHLMNNRPNIPQQQVMPKVYYQTSTRNKSFLEMSYFLKARGIKNYRFMLALYDPDLAGVDPYDPNLPLHMKVKVLKECQRNFWYFLRETVHIISSGSSQGVPYQLNRGNLAYNFCSSLNLNTYLELPRQIGKTTAAIVRYLWLYNFGTSNARMVFMNKSNQDAKRNLDELKNIRALLPSYLQMDQPYSEVSGKKKRIQSTVTNIQHPFNHNYINIVPGARNPLAASNLIRGMSLSLLFIDEWAFIKFNDIVYVNGIPALMRAFANAKAVGHRMAFALLQPREF